ncbi:hypothetical protein [Paraburkholderia fungorum]|uniref:Alpha/beta hydrolase n=1 Tax=Paraburkholderia fungorum TaxID=134537 RepID=A0A3R7EB43_9BURK|nr:hypothetical protein [Paraburkholderia fungorum]RKF50891.1 hypothetical protein BCY88_01585 [Paraburkholderia fungorum]
MNKIIQLFCRITGLKIRLKNPAVACAIALPFVLLSACSTPAVYLPGDPFGNPTGTVKPLSMYVGKDVTNIKLIFVHGVGDFCPGYALSGDSKNEGWLGNGMARKIGLDPGTGEPVTQPWIYSNEFLTPPKGTPHPYDDQSFVALRTQHFTYTPANIPLEAIEVTWSPLTQWVKNDRLREDFTEPGIFSCLNIDGGDPAQPPSRVLLNRVIKENILDRKLADAAIYMGQYHTVMQLGMADALCHALTGQEVAPLNPAAPNPVCDWRTAHVDPGTLYVFVTHSLGSRLLYDTLLGLLGKNAPGVDQSALTLEFPGAKDYVHGILGNTPVIYMMANQLTFLGMANITAQDTSKTATRKPAVVGVGMQPAAAAAADQGPCTDVICLLALAKAESAPHTTLKENPDTSRKLDVVAFSDTNDLLSWSIPPEYERDPLQFVNVYVRNATRFLIVENPVSAHGGYFTSKAVWDVIRCGAHGPTVNTCN